MKIRSEHLARMNAAVAPLDTTERRTVYKARGLSSERYRWDLFWFADKYIDTIFCELDYLLDAHIDTALRRIVPPL